MKKLGIIVIILVLSCQSESNSPIQQDFEQENDCYASSGEYLDIRFCILNDEGIATNIFKKDSNFFFNLELINISDSEIKIAPNFEDADFWLVSNIDKSTDFGKPYTGTWCEFKLGEKKIIIDPGEKITLNCPWYLETNGDDPTYPFCKSISGEKLDVGDFYTSMQLNFEITDGDEQHTLETSRLIFNFKIE